MSSRLGTGHPVVLIDGSSYSYPHAVAGGRTEEWREELGEGWINIDGDWIDGDEEFRFHGEYEWRGPRLTQAHVEQLLQWRNQRQRLVWQPYSDNTVYRVLCRIVELETPPGSVLSTGERVRLVVEGVSRVASVPIPDRRLLGDPKPKKGIVP